MCGYRFMIDTAPPYDCCVLLPFVLFTALASTNEMSVHDTRSWSGFSKFELQSLFCAFDSSIPTIAPGLTDKLQIHDSSSDSGPILYDGGDDPHGKLWYALDLSHTDYLLIVKQRRGSFCWRLGSRQLLH